MRWAPLVLALAACSDLRDFRGTWQGRRVGDQELLKVGVLEGATASITIDNIDAHGLAGLLAVDGLVDETPFSSLPGAEADVLSNMSFGGAPLRVYMTFVPVRDNRGEALALISLYDAHRIELRVLRGGTAPIYAIFSLAEGP